MLCGVPKGMRNNTHSILDIQYPIFEIHYSRRMSLARMVRCLFTGSEREHSTRRHQNFQPFPYYFNSTIPLDWTKFPAVRR
jgi:hypothetical protein